MIQESKKFSDFSSLNLFFFHFVYF